MIHPVRTVLLVLALVTTSAHGQSTTFIYDQQSAVEGASGGGPRVIPLAQPLGQSFVPTFTSLNFIRLQVYDPTPGNSLGATLYVNLRANSITGPIISATDPITFPDGYNLGAVGYPSFIFSSLVPVTPGTTYYFQPVVQSGDSWAIVG